jgi:hypothetical protein
VGDDWDEKEKGGRSTSCWMNKFGLVWFGLASPRLDFGLRCSARRCGGCLAWQVLA